MGIFGKIWDKLNGNRAAATGTAAGTGAAPSAPSFGTPAANFNDVSSASSSAPAAEVDVEAIMMDLERKSGHKSNWRESIVDLMSLLGIDNSLADRRELAKELGYTGDMNDTAPMNIWLHKQVMRRLAENGGKVPANLLD